MNIFDDMPNDLDSTTPHVSKPMEQIAQERYRTKAQFEEKCEKCHGRGDFITWAGRNLGPCRACNGQGKKLFSQPKEVRERNRARAAERKAKDLQDNIAAFKQDFPAEYEWMYSRANHFEFAASMMEAVHKWGRLTDNQMAAVQRCVESSKQREAAWQATRAATPVVRLAALHDVMQRHAKFYAGDVTLSRRNADQLVWIKHVNAEKVIGKIDGGVLTLWNRPGVDTEQVREMLNEFEGAPLQTAMKYGKLSGRCCSCGRELTNDGSIEAGIGPICAGKF